MIFWEKRIKKKSELAVFDESGSWTSAVGTAITTFNSLNLGVKLVTTKNKDEANIVVKVSVDADSIEWRGNVVNTNKKFDSGKAHGLSVGLDNYKSDKTLIGRFFAGIFLPGKYKATSQQKEVIVVHEFIHAAGMDDHDDWGVMVANFVGDGNGFKEMLPDKNSTTMPPIRVGAKTICTIKSAWSLSEEKK